MLNQQLHNYTDLCLFLPFLLFDRVNVIVVNAFHFRQNYYERLHLLLSLIKAQHQQLHFYGWYACEIHRGQD